MSLFRARRLAWRQCHAAVLVALVAGTAAAQPPLTEAQYVERVLAGSLEARVAEAQVALGHAEAVGVGLWPNPSLIWDREQATFGAGEVVGQDILALSIPLVLSGRLSLESRSAALGAQAAEARLARARGELRHEASQAFSAALAAQERQAVLEESLSHLRRLAEAIAVRERAGEAAGYERLRMELEVATLEDVLRGATLEAWQARARAQRLLGPGAPELPALQGPLAPERALPPVEALWAELERRRADARALELEAQQAQAASQAAARAWIPEPTLRAGAQLLNPGQPGAGTGYVAGLTLPLPLFERWQGEEARARARQQLAESRRAALLHAARSRLAEVLEEVARRRERRRTHREAVLARAEELRRIAEAAYQGGSADLLVLVDAERTAREARLTAIALSLAAAEAEADLFLLSGAWDGAAPGSDSP